MSIQPQPDRVIIFDTTLRDGSQGEGVNFSLQDKLLLTRRLEREYVWSADGVHAG